EDRRRLAARRAGGGVGRHAPRRARARVSARPAGGVHPVRGGAGGPRRARCARPAPPPC
ncbi:MAG: hypothetical protein AVDCRST_MAG11-315, partial [uncultured Gemmatimonadaceae bacterium]